ncbi:MAG: sulfurtransferase TusA family protein [Candidatus Odinarchaeum yellowstonii]|uniref:Sulfurtransferase TusA family protein n=1 Tax=Odinarchaeota yellowstonii (strain LCB_4) TaxID=1841599 RepID=A0AAF0D1Z0_ODILC|nr:MAG: sulfurtransferase TusA family protein [Candidatus Odinarchaeum yellowstonii]
MSKNKPTLKIDCTGLYCPQPVFITRTTLDEMSPGEILEVLADDPAAESDIKALVEALGHELLSFSKEGGVLKFLIRKR